MSGNRLLGLGGLAFVGLLAIAGLWMWAVDTQPVAPAPPSPAAVAAETEAARIAEFGQFSANACRFEPAAQPKIGDSERVLAAWLDCLQCCRPDVHTTETPGLVRKQYVIRGGLDLYYYTDNGRITGIQR